MCRRERGSCAVGGVVVVRDMVVWGTEAGKGRRSVVVVVVCHEDFVACLRNVAGRVFPLAWVREVVLAVAAGEVVVRMSEVEDAAEKAVPLSATFGEAEAEVEAVETPEPHKRRYCHSYLKMIRRDSGQCQE